MFTILVIWSACFFVNFGLFLTTPTGQDSDFTIKTAVTLGILGLLGPAYTLLCLGGVLGRLGQS